MFKNANLLSKYYFIFREYKPLKHYISVIKAYVKEQQKVLLMTIPTLTPKLGHKQWVYKWKNSAKNNVCMIAVHHSGQENLEKSRQKNSWNQINQFHEKKFFTISKMAKDQFLNWEKV